MSDVGGLLLTELTTNAVVHARTMFVVTTVLRSAGLRVRVDDRSFQQPRLLASPAYPSEVVGGWGLQLVDQLATRWGHEPRPDGKSVWFELDPVDLANRLS